MRTKTLKANIKNGRQTAHRYLGWLNSPVLHPLLLAVVAMSLVAPSDSHAYVTSPTTAVAGNNVRVVQYGKSLFIYGDQYDNAIRIGQFHNGDMFVEGLQCDGVETFVNHNSDEEFEAFSGVVHVYAFMGAGHDCVAVSNNLYRLSNCLGLGEAGMGESKGHAGMKNDIFIPGILQVITSSGDDSVYIGGVETGGAMTVITNTGDDDVGLCDFYVGTRLLVSTGNDEDRVKIAGMGHHGDSSYMFEEPTNYVRYTATINTGIGDDEVCIDNLFTELGGLNVYTLAGNDDAFIGDCYPFSGQDERLSIAGRRSFVDIGKTLRLDMGSGDDNGAIGNTLVGTHLVVAQGTGEDDLWIDDVSVNQIAILDTGRDDDFVWIERFDTGADLILNLQHGNDDAIIYNVDVGSNLFATLGLGNDDLDIDYVGIAGMTYINGGGQNDYVGIYDSESNWFRIFMGSGDDELYIDYSSAMSLMARGGTGVDCIDNYGFFTNEDISEFEFECEED